MSIKRGSGSQQGFTFVELMVASALALMAATVIAFFSYFTTRSFAAATNYTDMNFASRVALDNMSRTIRGSQMVTAYTSNSITI
jgi:prepilin-type N-terminal cleavage/methylation domain-containing protein